MWKRRTLLDLHGESPLCPKCGGEYLHQTNTTIYERSEDDDWTTVMKQDGHEMVVTKFPSADTHNPSYRRHGLVIDFTCENCHNVGIDGKGRELPPRSSEPFHLAIFQHKGVTYIEWVE